MLKALIKLLISFLREDRARRDTFYIPYSPRVIEHNKKLNEEVEDD